MIDDQTVEPSTYRRGLFRSVWLLTLDTRFYNMNKDVVYQFVFLNLNENNSSDNVTREQKLGAFDKPFYGILSFWVHPQRKRKEKVTGLINLETWITCVS